VPDIAVGLCLTALVTALVQHDFVEFGAATITITITITIHT